MDKKGLRKRAVALGYDPDTDEAPRVKAKGAGRLAEKIIEVARAHGIPLRQDPGLVELLAGVEVAQEIPEVLFRAVAEVLAFIYLMERGIDPSAGEEIIAPSRQ